MTWDPSEPHSIQRLQIIYKIAERCNLNCSYCYYYNMGDDSALHRPVRASLPTTGNLAQWLAQGCRELDIPEVMVSFHGGEPMLLRALDFAEACETLVRAIAPVGDLRFSIQTNGTLLTAGWLEALTRFNVSVGVSIDGRREDHDRFRLDHQGRSTFAETEAAIARLMEASERHPHLAPGTISVMHPAVDYRATYRYLRSLGVRSLHFLLPDRNADGLISADDAVAIGKGLLDIFEAWMIEDDPDINVRFIHETLGHFDIRGGTGGMRRRRKTNQILVARSDGTVAVDDSLIPALTWYKTAPEFPIAQHSLRDVFRDPIFRLLEAERNRLPDDCAGCRWSDICRGGDLENRYSTARGFNNPSVYCLSYKTLYSGVCNFLAEIGYPKPEIDLRIGVLDRA